MGEVATPLIERNTTIPTRKSQIFSTASDSQTQVEIHVVQGERSLAADNKSLGRFILDGIPPASRGIPQIEVVFDVDANGILKISARDRATGRSQNITLSASSGLSADELQRMRKEAEAHAEDDHKLRDMIEARNYADATIYNAEHFLREQAVKDAGSSQQEVEQALARLKSAWQGKDVSEIKSLTQNLERVLKLAGSFTDTGKPDLGPAYPHPDARTAPFDGIHS